MESTSFVSPNTDLSGPMGSLGSLALCSPRLFSAISKRHRSLTEEAIPILVGHKNNSKPALARATSEQRRHCSPFQMRSASSSPLASSCKIKPPDSQKIKNPFSPFHSHKCILAYSQASADFNKVPCVGLFKYGQNTQSEKMSHLIKGAIKAAPVAGRRLTSGWDQITIFLPVSNQN